MCAYVTGQEYAMSTRCQSVKRANIARDAKRYRQKIHNVFFPRTRNVYILNANIAGQNQFNIDQRKFVNESRPLAMGHPDNARNLELAKWIPFFRQKETFLQVTYEKSENGFWQNLRAVPNSIGQIDRCVARVKRFLPFTISALSCVPVEMRKANLPSNIFLISSCACDIFHRK